MFNVEIAPGREAIQRMKKKWSETFREYLQSMSLFLSTLLPNYYDRMIEHIAFPLHLWRLKERELKMA